MVATEISAGVLAVFFALWFLFMLIALLCFVFWIVMLIDCVKRTMNDTEKVVWILVIAITGFLGATIYYFVVKRKHRK